jgi:mRNA-degrading endonuclease toxin of MazEF toxin-antitoxin module
MKDIHKNYYTINKNLSNCIECVDDSNDDDVKRIKNLTLWIDKKLTIIQNENNLIIPSSFLPQSIDTYKFNKLEPQNQTITKKYYTQSNNSYRMNASVSLSNDEIYSLVSDLMLRRGNVVWVDFGFNIDVEFGGKHPALILKNTGKSLIVVPLSSQTPSNIKDYHVKINRVYGFKNITRWVNILRIQPISLHRIDFHSNTGSVKGSVLNNIRTAINTVGIY